MLQFIRNLSPIRIGVLSRERQTVFLRVNIKNPQLPTVDESLIISHKKENSVFRNLEAALSQVPPSFFQHAPIIFCLPFKHLTIQKLVVPKLKKEDLDQLVSQQVDTSHDAWDYQVFSETIKEDHVSCDLGIFKLRKTGLEGYLEIFQKYKLYVDRVITEPTVFRHLFSTGWVEPSEETFLLADLDSKHLKLYIYSDGSPVYFRSIPLGYFDIVSSLTRTIRHQDKDIAISHDKAKEILSNYPVLEGKSHPDYDFPLDHLFFLVRPNLEKLSIEIKKTITFFPKA